VARGEKMIPGIRAASGLSAAADTAADPAPLVVVVMVELSGY
jgi:hypothetical protein